MAKDTNNRFDEPFEPLPPPHAATQGRADAHAISRAAHAIEYQAAQAFHIRKALENIRKRVDGGEF